MLSLKDMPTTASTMYSAYANFAALSMLVRSMANELIPVPIRVYIYSFLHSLLRYFFGPLLFSQSHDLTLIVDESSDKIGRNQVFDAAELYLRGNISPSAERLRVSKAPKQKTISLGFDKGQEFTDTFNNIKLKWLYVYTEPSQNKGHPTKTQRYFELTFHKKHRDQVVDCYLPHVIARAQAIKEEQKIVKLYTRHSPRSYDDEGDSSWGSIRLDHPATFETMAMDPDLKTMIKEDLDRFVRRKEFYKKVGKAWKRGYLLYGPPGTGKSSLIAAMANYLKFDIYDLELTGNLSDSSLRRTLLSTTNRSILVIEDIDCSVKMKKRHCSSDSSDDDMFIPYNKQLTLSGLLNFIDGLWSSCGDERIFVVTTNHKDRLDPALLRPGRMDVHIHMSYCTPSGFRTLASNYLGIHEGDPHPHPLFPEIEGLIQSTQVTPAEVAEEFMKSEDADVVLHGLVNFLEHTKVQGKRQKMKNTSF